MYDEEEEKQVSEASTWDNLTQIEEIDYQS